MTTANHVDLRILIGQVLAVDPEELADDSGPLTIPAWTSLKHLELILALEKSYGVALSRRDITGMRSVGAVRAALRDNGVQA